MTKLYADDAELYDIASDSDIAEEADCHGAVSPINTLLHLTPDQLGRHLQCMAAHLEPHSRYPR